jgi:hypothetical protein
MSGRRYVVDRGSDALDRACDRIWFEIRRLLPRHRRLYELGHARSRAQAKELEDLARRVQELRSLALRYRDVLRQEAWARYDSGEEET